MEIVQFFQIIAICQNVRNYKPQQMHNRITANQSNSKIITILIKMQESSQELTPDLQPLSYISPLLAPIAPPKPLLTKTQYKNGTYYGKYDNHQQRCGIGIVVYDDGDILVGEFREGALRGFFMCFDTGGQAGLRDSDGKWVYGVCVADRMDGEAYVYGRDHRAVKVVFRDGVVVGDCSYNHGKYTGITNTYTYRKQNMNHSQFLSPSDFLQTHLSISPSSSPSSSNLILPQSSIPPSNQSHLQPTCPQFKVFQIAHNQIFYGTTQNNKPNGIGIILLDQWPVCYGNFVEGQLEGLGRVQQNRAMLLDGLFGMSCLRVGWVLDFKEMRTCFGVLVEDSKKNKLFKLTEQHQNIHPQKLTKFRRRQHLQSLTYTNSHIFQLLPKIKPQFLPQHFTPLPSQSPSHKPQSLLQLPKQQNFIPSFISEISRVHQENTPKSMESGGNRNRDRDRERDRECDGSASMRIQRDLVELIKEYNQNRNQHQKTSRAVSEMVKESERVEHVFQDFTKQNYVITYNMTKSPTNRSRTNSRSINKDTLEFTSSKPPKNLTKNGSIHNIHLHSVPRPPAKQPPSNTSTVTKQNKNKPVIATNRYEDGRKVQRRLDLHQMYNKYLRKEE